jgi:hypothetical protein
VHCTHHWCWGSNTDRWPRLSATACIAPRRYLLHRPADLRAWSNRAENCCKVCGSSAAALSGPTAQAPAHTHCAAWQASTSSLISAATTCIGHAVFRPCRRSVGLPRWSAATRACRCPPRVMPCHATSCFSGKLKKPRSVLLQDPSQQVLCCRESVDCRLLGLAASADSAWKYLCTAGGEWRTAVWAACKRPSAALRGLMHRPRLKAQTAPGKPSPGACCCTAEMVQSRTALCWLVMQGAGLLAHLAPEFSTGPCGWLRCTGLAS